MFMHAAASPQDALVLLEDIFASQCPAKSHSSIKPFPFFWEHLCFPCVFLLQVRDVCGASPVMLVVKTLPAKVGEIRDMDSTPGSG